MITGEENKRREISFLNSRWQANAIRSQIALQTGKAGTRMMNDDEQEPGGSCPNGHGGPSQVLHFPEVYKITLILLGLYSPSLELTPN